LPPSSVQREKQKKRKKEKSRNSFGGPVVGHPGTREGSSSATAPRNEPMKVPKGKRNQKRGGSSAGSSLRGSSVFAGAQPITNRQGGSTEKKTKLNSKGRGKVGRLPNWRRHDGTILLANGTRDLKTRQKESRKRPPRGTEAGKNWGKQDPYPAKAIPEARTTKKRNPQKKTIGGKRRPPTTLLW